jgi:hypothetical protein
MLVYFVKKNKLSQIWNNIGMIAYNYHLIPFSPWFVIYCCVIMRKFYIYKFYMFIYFSLWLQLTLQYLISNILNENIPNTCSIGSSFLALSFHMNLPELAWPREFIYLFIHSFIHLFDCFCEIK